MELRHLKYFVALGDTLHVSRAAARLGIAQPTLSQQLRQLEEQMQTLLLRRIKRRVELTEAGRLFLDDARDILARADRAAVVARRASLKEADRVRIGFPYWADVTPVLTTIIRLTNRREGFRFDIRTMSVPRLVAGLKEGTLDVALVRPPLNEASLSAADVSADPFIVALPASHRLATRRRIALATLADERFVLFPREVVPRYHDLAIGLCRQAGFVPNVQDEVDSAYLVLRLVAAGLGVSLVPAFARKEAVPPGVVFRAVEPSALVLHAILAWRRDESSAAVVAFVEALREVVGLSRAAERRPSMIGDGSRVPAKRSRRSRP